MASVAVKFAQALVEHKGQVTSAELLEVRNAGYSDTDIVEIITHVGKASRVEIDFPTVDLQLAS